jgi:hypothetical protein
MKHLLNDMTEKEKNAIREQHTGGMTVMTENFSKLLNSKLGDSKPLVSEQNTPVKLKKGDIVTIVKKSDTSSKPMETDAMVKVVYDAGNGQQRIGYKISGGNESQTDFDPKKMEFQDYKIIMINGQPVNQPAKPVQPPIPKVPTKGSNKIVFPTPEKKKNLFLSPETLKRLRQGQSQKGQKVLSPDTLKKLGYK